MELEYTPTLEDLVALAYHKLAISPAVQGRLRRVHLAYVIGCSLLSVAAYFVLPSDMLSIAFAAFASLVLFAFPYISRWRLRRSLPPRVRRRAPPAAYATRRLHAHPDGLEQITEQTHSRVGWRAVDAVFETARHTYLSIDGTYSVVIPRERVSPEDYDRFMEAVREFRVGAR